MLYIHQSDSTCLYIHLFTLSTKMKALFSLFLLYSSLLASALSLTCYKCDASSSISCNYDILSFSYDTVDCTKGLLKLVPQQCVKVVAKIKDGGEHVARGCFPRLGIACKAIAKTLGFFGSVASNIEDMDCIPCDGDKCNADSKFVLYISLGILLAIFAAITFLVYKLLSCSCCANQRYSIVH